MRGKSPSPQPSPREERGEGARNTVRNDGDASLRLSSLRKQGPITTGFDSYKRFLPPCPNETTRRMGPRVRGDDGLRRSRSHQIPLSSPGVTGRPGTPRPLDSCSGASFLPRPACGERSKPKASGEGGSPRVRMRGKSPSPQPSPREERGEGARNTVRNDGDASLRLSSLRKQGPITTGFDSYKRFLPPCPNETTRRMGPRVRGDDGLRRSRSHQIPLSSPGVTGRPGTPRPLDSCSGASFLPRPACGERSKPKASGEGGAPRVRMRGKSPSPPP